MLASEKFYKINEKEFIEIKRKINEQTGYLRRRIDYVIERPGDKRNAVYLLDIQTATLALIELHKLITLK